MAERGSFENPVPFNELTDDERAEFGIDRLMDALDDPRSVVLGSAQPDGAVKMEVLLAEDDDDGGVIP